MAQLTHLAHRLYEHVRREGLLPRGAHVVVACSGGPDSLALLSLLLELRRAAIRAGLRVPARR